MPQLDHDDFSEPEDLRQETEESEASDHSVISTAVSRAQILSAEQEISIAKEIERLEVLLWDRLLRDETTRDHALDTVRDLVDDIDTEIPDTAVEIRAIARDRKFLKAVVDRVEKSATNAQDLRRVSELRSLISAVVRTKDKLVTANLRFAAKKARAYTSPGFGFDDAFQEASAGLIIAADRYDPGRGYKFLTYASWWVRQSITHAKLNSGRAVRLPAHILDRLRPIRRATQVLWNINGRAPTHEEIADVVGMEPDRVRQVLSYLHSDISLDSTVPGTDMPFFEVIPDTGSHEAVTASRDNRALDSAISDLLGRVHGREAEVIRRRFGFEGEEQTLQTVADAKGVTRERVRQIEQLGLIGARSVIERDPKLLETLSSAIGVDRIAPHLPRRVGKSRVNRCSFCGDKEHTIRGCEKKREIESPSDPVAALFETTGLQTELETGSESGVAAALRRRMIRGV